MQIKILLAAVVAVSQINASTQQETESLWAVSSGGTLSVCEYPSSQMSLDTCFSGVPKFSDFDAPMATNGINVYYSNPDDGAGSIVSCPISSLGDGCQSLGFTDLQDYYPYSMAASTDYLYLGYSAGFVVNRELRFPLTPNNMYRCPLDGSSGGCEEFNYAGNRAINSLVLGNNRLYAGLGQSSTIGEDGLIWNCDPITQTSCSDFNKPGKTSVNTLAVSVGYLWAGLSNGIIWRCSLDEPDSCLTWYENTDEVVKSISFDAEDGTTFYAGTADINKSKNLGRIYTCSTNTQNDCKVSPSNGGRAVESVAGGMGSVFWSLRNQNAEYIYTGTSTTYAAFTSSTSSNWSRTQLLYFSGSTLTTINIVGTSTTGGGRNLMKQDNDNCQERAEKVYDALKDIIGNYTKFFKFIDDEDISCAISKGSFARGVVKSANECSITIDVVAKVRGLELPLKKHIADQVSDFIDNFDVERVEVEPTCKDNVSSSMCTL